MKMKTEEGSCFRRNMRHLLLPPPRQVRKLDTPIEEFIEDGFQECVLAGTLDHP